MRPIYDRCDFTALFSKRQPFLHLQQQEDYLVETQAANSLINDDQTEENDEWIQPTYTDVLDIASENLNCGEDAG